MRRELIVLLFLALFTQVQGQNLVPKSYSNIYTDQEGKLYLQLQDKKIYMTEHINELNYDQMIKSVSATADGLKFNFKMPNFNGLIYYGFIPYGDSKHPLPVYFHSYAKITNGKAEIDIRHKLSGRYDMIDWETTKKGVLGYRVVNAKGRILFENKIGFKANNKFSIDLSLIEGPFINLLQADGSTISFQTNKKVKAIIEIDGKQFTDKHGATQHEIKVTGLNPNTKYNYKVIYGDNEQQYSFTTALEKGSREPFTFGYASDSRGGRGGGERSMYGVNFYITKKIMALATQQQIRFMQFTGDLINGYSLTSSDMQLQYHNWKKAVEPFAHYYPVIATMGNHESLSYLFLDKDESKRYNIDKFPFERSSAEAVFARNFVNPVSDLISEDGADYDPSKNTIDFPPYSETVFSYTYANVAIVVLNSNYFYTTSSSLATIISGNIHAYIMDNQLKWLEKEVAKYEYDSDIDHIFITVHTPPFPNGGHVSDDMWYRGNNSKRAYVNGKPVDKGIIERRDQILDIAANKSKKVVAFLTGDEHNYCLTKITPEMERYPENYKPDKIELTRTIYQINNGAAGAPYYAQEQTPWTEFTSGFTTQNVLVIIHIDGKKVWYETLNPDTLEKISEVQLRN